MIKSDTTDKDVGSPPAPSPTRIVLLLLLASIIIAFKLLLTFDNSFFFEIKKGAIIIFIFFFSKQQIPNSFILKPKRSAKKISSFVRFSIPE